MSADVWKRQLREKARVAMPGGMREAAASGRIPLASGWKLPGRNCPTGAGREPLKLGEAAPRGTGRPNGWHVVAARKYR